MEYNQNKGQNSKQLNLNSKEFIPKEKRTQENTISISPDKVNNTQQLTSTNTNSEKNSNQQNLNNNQSKTENKLKFRLDSKEYIPKSMLNVHNNPNSQNLSCSNYVLPYYYPYEQNKFNMNSNMSKEDFNINYYQNYDNYNKIPNSKKFEEDNIDDDDDGDELADKFFDEIIDENNILFDEDDESDDEKWFPKYRNCDCCKGFVYKCEGDTCKSLGKCYCKIKSQIDGDCSD